MKVPEGKTLYFGKKKLKAGDEIPPTLESKFSKTLNKKPKGDVPKKDIPILSESEKKDK